MVGQTTEESATHLVNMFVVMVVCLSAMNSVHCVHSYDVYLDTRKHKHSIPCTVVHSRGW